MVKPMRSVPLPIGAPEMSGPKDPKIGVICRDGRHP
jgi:hypothetical protein